MFLPILLFELKYRLKRPATWIYFAILFLMAFLLVTAAGGGYFSKGNYHLVLTVRRKDSLTLFVLFYYKQFVVLLNASRSI